MSEMNDKRKAAFDALGIEHDHKAILCLDGGGIRGIMTLQLLKKVEELAGIPCYELFDMVAGTSTGGIITGLIASKRTAVEIEQLYIDLVGQVFKKRSKLSNRIINPPEYDKVNYRKQLKELLKDNTLLDVCTDSGIDVMITSKDITAGEETFFTCFNDNNNFSGTYKDVLLRAAMESTMSAPTYFNPLERFVDGGTTTYNNPTMAAIMEAVHYCPGNKYQLNKLSVMSFGTGTSIEFVNPDETLDPKGIDAVFWLNLVMRESSQDASDMQINLIRSGIIPKMDYRRYQLSLDTVTMHKLPNIDISDVPGVDANWLWDLTNDDLKGIELDDVTKFPLMKVIGEQMVAFVMNEGNDFKSDLVDENNHDSLVTRFGDIVRIKAQMSNPVWLDDFPS